MSFSAPLASFPVVRRFARRPSFVAARLRHLSWGVPAFCGLSRESEQSPSSLRSVEGEQNKRRRLKMYPLPPSLRSVESEQSPSSLRSMMTKHLLRRECGNFENLVETGKFYLPLTIRAILSFGNSWRVGFRFAARCLFGSERKALNGGFGEYSGSGDACVFRAFVAYERLEEL